MVNSRNDTSPAVDRQLEREPYRFDFFQAVRLLRLAAQRPGGPRRGAGRCPVGQDGPPTEEIVRFHALQSHTFPSSAIRSFQAAQAASDTELSGSSAAVAEMVVTFLGLTGPSGVLPQHYSQLLIDRCRRKDFALRDFFDLFNHRIISLFYRAWEKYRFAIGYEEVAAELSRAGEDLFTRSLYCLVGLGTGGLRGRLQVSDETFLYYGGLYAHFPRNAISLEVMIVDDFNLPAQILQFHGQWLRLSQEDQTCFSSRDDRGGRNNQLGTSAVVGERVWGVENKFRIRLGPLGYERFCRFAPMGDGLTLLGQLARTYAGPDFDFDVQVVLRRNEVPPTRLGGDTAGGSRLGWNTWVSSLPFRHDADDAVFEVEGWPDNDD